MQSEGKPERDSTACYQSDGPTEIDPQRYQSADSFHLAFISIRLWGELQSAERERRERKTWATWLSLKWARADYEAHKRYVKRIKGKVE